MNDECKFQLERLFNALANVRELMDKGAIPDIGPYPQTAAGMLRDMAKRIEALGMREAA